MRKFLPAYTLHVETTNLRCSEAYQEAFRTSEQVARLAREFLATDEREHFCVLFLDTKNRIKGAHEVGVGTLTACLVHPREAFRLAVQIGASAVIFFHNHPSGAPEPSREDTELTRRLYDAGKILGIRVLDHIIVADHGSRHYSFADAGEFPLG